VVQIIDFGNYTFRYIQPFNISAGKFTDLMLRGSNIRNGNMTVTTILIN
jgi:hypothetical protein